MCNAYKIGKQGAVSGKEVVSLVFAAVDRLPSPLVRRTGRGVVVRNIDGEFSADLMRWGFFHAKHGEVNNTRCESMKSPFWAESLAQRRCLVPISEYYEWKELPTGAPKGMRKPCFSFSRPDGGYLWVAGVWQAFEGIGECYSTITTKPAPLVEPIHDRQLAVLEWEEALAFLAGDKVPGRPYEGPLRIQEVPSPLRRSSGKEKSAKEKPSPPPQGELF